MKTVIEMAREAGFATSWTEAAGEALERFAELVRADEREVCAKVCEELTFSKAGPSVEARRQRLLCAEAIRARGEASIRGNT